MARTDGRTGIRRGHRRSIAALEVGVKGRIVKGSRVERSEWSALRFLESGLN